MKSMKCSKRLNWWRRSTKRKSSWLAAFKMRSYTRESRLRDSSRSSSKRISYCISTQWKSDEPKRILTRKRLSLSCISRLLIAPLASFRRKWKKIGKSMPWSTSSTTMLVNQSTKCSSKSVNSLTVMLKTSWRCHPSLRFEEFQETTLTRSRSFSSISIKGTMKRETSKTHKPSWALALLKCQLCPPSLMTIKVLGKAHREEK